MPEPAKRKRGRTVRRFNVMRFIILTGIFLFVVSAGAATILIASAAKDLPSFDPKILQPSIPSALFDKNGNTIARIYQENYTPVDFKDIPDQTKKAFLAIEDIRFYQHNGLDLQRIMGAFWADIKAGKAAEGASTITQQLVKRTFLTPDKTLKRKIQEAILAVELERRYTKDEIFGMYINQIFFGQGAYGIASASQVYFGKDVSKLNLDEAALLAGLPQAPSRYDPFKNVSAATARRNLVLGNMAKYGFITSAQAAAAKARPVLLTGTGAQSKQLKYPYFVNYVTQQLVNKYGADMVYKGGLQVHTTMDPKVQAYAEEALANRKNFPGSVRDGNGIIQPEAAMVVLDPHTGGIRALVGGREYRPGYSFNRAVDAVRQPGSAFKPLVDYGPAIEAGKGPDDAVLDGPLTIGGYSFKNYDGGYHGWVTYRQAIINSFNIPAVKILDEIGVQTGLNFAKSLGITTLVDSSESSSHNDENLSTALGGLTRGVKPLELAAAYGAFANNGVYIQPSAITEVTDSNGLLIDRFTPQKTIAMKQTTAFTLTDMMESVVSYGTGKAAAFWKQPVAGKTGTTSDYKDAWFAGYTPQLVGVVWMGNDRPKPMYGVTGGNYPARIWRDVMSKALADTPWENFQVPANWSSGSERGSGSANSGGLDNSGRPNDTGNNPANQGNSGDTGNTGDSGNQDYTGSNNNDGSGSPGDSGSSSDGGGTGYTGGSTDGSSGNSYPGSTSDGSGSSGGTGSLNNSGSSNNGGYTNN